MTSPELSAKPTRGGKRAGAGRKPSPEPLKNRSIKLSDEHYRRLKGAGMAWLREQLDLLPEREIQKTD